MGSEEMKIKVCLCEGVFDRSNPVSPRLCEGVCDRGNPGDRNGNRGLDCFAKPRKDGRGISVFARESSTAAIQGSGREQGAGLLRKASQRRTGKGTGSEEMKIKVCLCEETATKQSSLPPSFRASLRGTSFANDCVEGRDLYGCKI